MRHVAHLLSITVVLMTMTSCTGQYRNIMDYPESKIYLICLKREAYKSYRLPGGPLELGIVGSSACDPEFKNLIDTVEATEGRTYASALERRMRTSGATVIAKDINDLRRKGGSQ